MVYWGSKALVQPRLWSCRTRERHHPYRSGPTSDSMLKMFLREVSPGGTPEFWEKNWATLDLEAMVKVAVRNPLRPLFDRFLKPGQTILEGGCGLGYYVVYYSDKGFNVVGLDFAHRTLANLYRTHPGLQLITGDVARLPFRSGIFDVYYSGGVVEHFEHGPEEALREAHRVLRQGGVLLISVPYYSPLRRLFSPFKRDWRRLRRPDLKGKEGLEFFQYAFTRAEFERRLRNAGLKTIETKAFSVLWGWKEAPGVSFIMGLVHRARRIGQAAAPSAGAVPGDAPAPLPAPTGGEGLLSRLLLAEDTSIPVFGALLRLAGLAGANMMMYVCVPDAAGKTEEKQHQAGVGR